MTRKDFIVCLGDTGILWNNSRKDRLNELVFNQLEATGATILVVAGNHDNILHWRKYPLVDFHEGQARQLRDSVFALEHGQIYEIENRTFFVMGGGYSIDKNRRIDGVTWWKEEMPSYAETKFAIDQLLAMNKQVDFILTHTCSHRTFDKIAEKFDMSHKHNDGEKSLRGFFEWVEENVDFNEWHFGHFHEDWDVDDKHFLHYNNKPRRIV